MFSPCCGGSCACVLCVPEAPVGTGATSLRPRGVWRRRRRPVRPQPPPGRRVGESRGGDHGDILSTSSESEHSTLQTRSKDAQSADASTHGIQTGIRARVTGCAGIRDCHPPQTADECKAEGVCQGVVVRHTQKGHVTRHANTTDFGHRMPPSLVWVVPRQYSSGRAKSQVRTCRCGAGDQ